MQASHRFMIRIGGQGPRGAALILEGGSLHISQPVLWSSWLFGRELHTFPQINPKSAGVRYAKVQCVVCGSGEYKSLCHISCDILISISWIVDHTKDVLKMAFPNYLHDLQFSDLV